MSPIGLSRLATALLPVANTVEELEGYQKIKRYVLFDIPRWNYHYVVNTTRVSTPELEELEDTTCTLLDP